MIHSMIHVFFSQPRLTASSQLASQASKHLGQNAAHGPEIHRGRAGAVPARYHDRFKW